MSNSQVPAKLTQGIPDKTIVVNDDNEIHTGEGKKRVVGKPGDTLTLPGPEADDLVLAGHATYAEDE